MTIGERLKASREAKKITLDEACNVTKIQRKTLEAMEGDRLDEILNPAYARIFLKKYAAYLGVDGAVLLEEYKSTHAIDPAPELQVETEVTRGRQQSAASFWLMPAGAGLLALIGIATLGYFTLDLYHTLARNRRERPQGKPASVEEKRPTAAPELLVPAFKPLKLTIQTTADAWLQVKADGTILFQNVLAKGSSENWTAKRELELWTGNAGALRLSLNGKPLEGLGRGVRKGVRITHAGIQ